MIGNHQMADMDGVKSAEKKTCPFHESYNQIIVFRSAGGCRLMFS
jgi:hypothetical protein